MCRNPSARLFDRLVNAAAVERLQQVIDSVYLKGTHGVLVECCRKDDLRQLHLLIEQLLDDGKAVESWHLHIKEDQVRLMGADQVDGLDAVRALRKHLHTARFFKQVEKLLPRERLVIYDDGREGCCRT